MASRDFRAHKVQDEKSNLKTFLMWFKKVALANQKGRNGLMKSYSDMHDVNWNQEDFEVKFQGRFYPRVFLLGATQIRDPFEPLSHELKPVLSSINSVWL